MTARIARRRSGCKCISLAAVAVALGVTLATACTGSAGSPLASPAEWRASVCDSGAAGSLNALAEGIDASDLNVCASSNPAAGAAYVVSGKYSSSDRLQYYLTNHAAFRDSPYATASASNGTIWAFVAFVDGIGRGEPALALKPLEEFNFELHTAGQATSSSTSVAQPLPSPTRDNASTSTGNGPTIADYIKKNGITETHVVESGDPPGAPILNLPSPPGWRDSGNTPSYAYGQIVPTDPAFASDPPTITAIYSRLTGAVDADAILHYAPAELNNLPEFRSRDGAKSFTVKGFKAINLAGVYRKNGTVRSIIQITTVIAGKDGLYVLQLNSDWLPGSPRDQVVSEALRVIAKGLTITP